MPIDYARTADLDYLVAHDRHLSPGNLERKVERHEILVLWHDDRRAGLLRFGFFWDEIPFMNLLWVQKELRSRGSEHGSLRSGRTRCSSPATRWS